MVNPYLACMTDITQTMQPHINGYQSRALLRKHWQTHTKTFIENVLKSCTHSQHVHLQSVDVQI